MTNQQTTHADAMHKPDAVTQAFIAATHLIAAYARFTWATGLFFLNNAAAKPLATVGGITC